MLSLDKKASMLTLRFPNTVFDTSIHSSRCWPSTLITFLSVFPPVLTLPVYTGNAALSC